MAQNSNIEWCDHTVNLWWGCAKVHTGCKNCYAEDLSHRYGNKIWGEKAPRKRIKSAFKDLDKYQKRAVKEGVKYKIFCGSMMDICEDNKKILNPIEEIDETRQLRAKLFKAIADGQYDNLIFLFLTKRPENIGLDFPMKWTHYGIDDNVWFGASVSNQATADEIVPKLVKADIERRFLSVEPQVGAIDLTTIKAKLVASVDEEFYLLPAIDWVIQGGESGSKKRPFNLDWAYSLKEQCIKNGVPYFFKQIDKVQEIPSDLYFRQFPKF